MAPTPCVAQDVFSSAFFWYSADLRGVLMEIRRTTSLLPALGIGSGSAARTVLRMRMRRTGRDMKVE